MLTARPFLFLLSLLRVSSEPVCLLAMNGCTAREIKKGFYPITFDPHNFRPSTLGENLNSAFDAPCRILDVYVAYLDKKPLSGPGSDREIIRVLLKQLYVGKDDTLHFAPFRASDSSFEVTVVTGLVDLVE
jgi:hypothetical protein